MLNLSEPVIVWLVPTPRHAIVEDCLDQIGFQQPQLSPEVHTLAIIYFHFVAQQALCPWYALFNSMASDSLANEMLKTLICVLFDHHRRGR